MAGELLEQDPYAPKPAPQLLQSDPYAQQTPAAPRPPATAPQTQIQPTPNAKESPMGQAMQQAGTGIMGLGSKSKQAFDAMFSHAPQATSGAAGMPAVRSAPMAMAPMRRPQPIQPPQIQMSDRRTKTSVVRASAEVRSFLDAMHRRG